MLSVLKSTGILSSLHDRILCNQIFCPISLEIVSFLNNVLNLVLLMESECNSVSQDL